ncbi:putative peptidase [Encephalitozoon intestinalis ATCC 50506]|uniref:Peptidase n=1 Tax=Encephalitozoon intestinalis (strain ATCC 50506) TaxID=876142 RepID=E0S9D0_ENCIT|nr:putative peptidase [Encephalitozoon intestinalis ATCC 50506]ADM12194.1 putative peptidase [Encephalitozoon intestinalis ATCC 50506]UTX46001.1 permuted papain fold peptidase PPPDE1 [Encephalitozoon intestinalis]
MTKYNVTLRVYPLGDETLKRFVASALKREEVHIWHTSIEVYGIEYFFQNGIVKAVPGSTSHGTPLKTHDLGTTEIPEIVFEDFLLSITEDFAPHKYHLLRNNCNNFTNIVALYLVEKSIPEYILELQNTALESEAVSSLVDMFFGSPGKI